MICIVRGKHTTFPACLYVIQCVCFLERDFYGMYIKYIEGSR